MDAYFSRTLFITARQASLANIETSAALTFSACPMTCRGGYGSFVADGWFTSGNVISVAADLDSGKMMVFCHGDADASDTAMWKTVDETCLQLGEAVGVGFFPAISGKGGAKIRCFLREVQCAPPSGDFVAVGAMVIGDGQVRFVPIGAANGSMRIAGTCDQNLKISWRSVLRRGRGPRLIFCKNWCVWRQHCNMQFRLA